MFFFSSFLLSDWTHLLECGFRPALHTVIVLVEYLSLGKYILKKTIERAKYYIYYRFPIDPLKKGEQQVHAPLTVRCRDHLT